MTETLIELYGTFFRPFLVIAPPYLLVGVVVGWLVFRAGRVGGSFWRGLVPGQVSLHVTSSLSGKLDQPLMTQGMWPVLWDPVRRAFWRTG